MVIPWGWFPGKLTLRWRWVCRGFIRSIIRINACKKEGKEAGLGGGRGWDGLFCHSRGLSQPHGELWSQDVLQTCPSLGRAGRPGFAPSHWPVIRCWLPWKEGMTLGEAAPRPSQGQFWRGLRAICRPQSQQPGKWVLPSWRQIWVMCDSTQYISLILFSISCVSGTRLRSAGTGPDTRYAWFCSLRTFQCPE